VVDFLFLPRPQFDEASLAKALATDEAAGIVADSIAVFETCDWTCDAINVAFAEVAERHGLKLGKAQAPVRVAVSGRMVGPPLFESLESLGRDETLRRLRALPEGVRVP
jgi:glutamyl-tRNA synthetase